MTRQQMQDVKNSDKSGIDKIRATYERMTPAGLQLVLKGILVKRMKTQERAVLLAIGLARLNAIDKPRADYVLMQAKLMKNAEKLIAEMEKIKDVA